MSPSRLAGIVVLLVTTGAFSPVVAEEDAEVALDRLSLEELLNQSLTAASKTEQTTREAPGVVSLVPAEAIATYGWVSLNDVLGSMPGFTPTQDYDRRTMGARGLFEGWNNNHLLLLVDGVPFNDNLYGSAYTWEITPLAMARSLEVIRGPGSALYGSYATNGVVQVNTVSARDIEGKAAFRARLGDHGLRLLDVLGGHQGTSFSTVVGNSSYETDGNEVLSYDGSGRVDDAGDLLQFTTRDERSNRYAWLKIEGEGELAGLSLQLHEQQWQFQTGHGWLWWIPDFDEAMHESRRLLSLRWAPPDTGKLKQEYVVRYQKHWVDWNQRYYPAGAFDDFYPSGTWEYLDTSAADVFLRAQLTYDLGDGASLLGGVEADAFRYGGDDEHYSNTDLDGTWAPFPGDRDTPLGPWLDYILDETLLSTGLFAQYSSGTTWDLFRLTLGARYDRLAFDYERVYEEGRPSASKEFSQLSPRLALVFLPTDDLVLKALAGRAFRTPTPTEMAGAHTWSLASNIEQLEPEQVTTAELVADWSVSPQLNWRTNLFHAKMENQIAYSTQNNNLSTNIYTATSAGLETELLFELGQLGGFLNYSYTRRLDEEIFDDTVAESDDQLTWAPAHRCNLGVNYQLDRLRLALVAHYQGEVRRRASDLGVQELPLGVGISLDMDQYRGRTVDSWQTVDANAIFAVNDHLELTLTATNLFDEEYYLVKNIGFPFDYQQTGRRVWFGATLTY